MRGGQESSIIGHDGACALFGRPSRRIRPAPRTPHSRGALGTWHLALGTWHLALGTWHLIRLHIRSVDLDAHGLANEVDRENQPRMRAFAHEPADNAQPRQVLYSHHN